MRQQGSRNSFVAGEGFPFLVACAVGTVVVWNYFGVLAALPVGALFALLFLVFRDPNRDVPAVPLGVVSPVDGKVVEIGATESGFLGGEVQRVRIRVDAFGTYTARCPVEGKIMDLAAENGRKDRSLGGGGLWVRTDEEDDVVLSFSGYRFALPPRAFIRYGERVGQGQRCAYLRLTRYAEVQVPVIARITATTGDTVTAGSDVLAKLPHH